MRPDKVVQLRRLQSERERRAGLDLARANAVVHGAVAALGVALDEQAAFRARRREREGTIYAALIEKPVRTVELELLHMELEALFRMEGVVQARVEEAERVVRDAEAELATVRSRYLASRRRHDKWREVEARNDREAALASERAQEMEQEDRPPATAPRLGDAA